MLTLMDMICHWDEATDGLEPRHCTSYCSSSAHSFVLCVYLGLANGSTSEAVGARPVDVRED